MEGGGGRKKKSTWQRTSPQAGKTTGREEGRLCGFQQVAASTLNTQRVQNRIKQHLFYFFITGDINWQLPQAAGALTKKKQYLLLL